MLRHTKSLRRAKGFTIVELLIVIVVIAILAAIVIVAYTGIQDKAKFAQKRTDIENLQKLVEMYYSENGSYPVTVGWNYQRRDGNNFIPGIVPQYAGTIPQVTDGPTGSPTNNTYIYTSNGTNYKLMRLYQSSIPSGEWAQVPASMHDGNVAYTDRWGVWSPGGAGF
jgi:prepilin-type N-terminal cleavage/methylation domain-containing protein